MQDKCGEDRIPVLAHPPCRKVHQTHFRVQPFTQVLSFSIFLWCLPWEVALGSQPGTVTLVPRNEGAQLPWLHPREHRSEGWPLRGQHVPPGCASCSPKQPLLGAGPGTAQVSVLHREDLQVQSWAAPQKSLVPAGSDPDPGRSDHSCQHCPRQRCWGLLAPRWCWGNGTGCQFISSPQHWPSGIHSGHLLPCDLPSWEKKLRIGYKCTVAVFINACFNTITGLCSNKQTYLLWQATKKAHLRHCFHLECLCPSRALDKWPSAISALSHLRNLDILLIFTASRTQYFRREELHLTLSETFDEADSPVFSCAFN